MIQCDTCHAKVPAPLLRVRGGEACCPACRTCFVCKREVEPGHGAWRVGVLPAMHRGECLRKAATVGVVAFPWGARMMDEK